MSTLKEVLSLLTAKEKRRGALVLAMVTVMALLETAGVASIMPFLTVLGNPETVKTNPVLATLYDTLGFEHTQSFLIALAAGAFALILFSAVFRIATHYVMNRFIEMRRHSVSARLLETYLRQPYAYFLDRNSGDMAKSILSEVDQLVLNVFRPGIQAIAYAIVAITLVTLLVILDPLLAVTVAIVIGGLYTLIFGVVRKLLGRIGRDRVIANKERFTTASEALGGIKDIKLLGREFAYLSRFQPVSTRFARHMATNQTLAQAPKFLVESIAVGGVLAITIFLMATMGGIGEILPVLGLYAFAGYKLLPAAQHVYQGATKLRFGAGAVHEIQADLQRREALAEIRGTTPPPLTLNHAVTLRNVSYRYPNAEVSALHDVDFTITVGSSVGIVGGTGAGKTTLVDLILGLLPPTHGHILVDDAPITEINRRAWQQTLGYVPQYIYLTDSSIAENIALGIPSAHIDIEQVKRSARMAQLHDFVTHEMPHQYDTVVGERGVRLSGGQRQRIGIARALYHDPSVLVFDEATSALDSVTEMAVMEAIEALHHRKTVILIAHRLSTVRHCDQLIFLNHGRIAAQGTFMDIKAKSPEFRSMATGT